jgi:hypothetical protein
MQAAEPPGQPDFLPFYKVVDLIGFELDSSTAETDILTDE